MPRGPFAYSDRIELRPKKSFGQNFLINDAICTRIVESFSNEEKTGRVLEVGPGKGALTRFLALNDDFDLKAVEADDSMADYQLNQNWLKESQLIRADFLKLPLDKVFSGQEFSVIGNFPYNISSQILFRVDKYRDLVPLVVGMFQKEVAERIVSKEGNKIYGVTSVLLGASYHASILFHVKPGNFFPVPKVTSSVIMLQRKSNYTVPCNRALFKSLVKASFGQRRKMLRNSIKSFIKDPSLLKKDIMTRRPEQLALEDFYNLTNQIEQQ